MGKLRHKRIAPDSSVINWKAWQGYEPTIQGDPEKRREYQAIEELFNLQDQGHIVLVALDQVDREIKKTSDDAKRGKLIETLRLCKEKSYLTRFEAEVQSKRASKSKVKSGINLGNGACFITDDDIHKIEEYITFSASLHQRVDLEVLATAAIAGVQVVVAVDSPLLRNTAIKEFVRQKDNIELCTPTQVIELLSHEIIKE